MPKVFYTIDEVAEMYNVDKKMVREWIAQGQLRVTVFTSNIYRISQNALDDFDATRAV